VLLKNPAADFNQDGWTVGLAIDGNPKTAWGIFPKVGQPHRALFEFEQPVGFREGTTFIFVFEQTHGGGHLIGRVRVSVPTAPQPLTAAEAVPETLTAILAMPADKRTDKQRAEMA